MSRSRPHADHERLPRRAARVVWDGRLSVRDGGIRACRPVAFVSPCDRLRLASPQDLSWTSVTAGNRMDVLLQLEGGPATRCRFESGPAVFAFAPAQARLAPLVVDAGGVSRRVVVEPAPDEDGPRRVELAWRDTRPVAGACADACAYSVRVTQVDQHRAWSSPVYVARRTRAGRRQRTS